MGATFAELFPTRVRATGQGFSYNTGRAIGSFVPTLVGVAAGSMGLGQAMGICSACSYVLVLLAVAALPETRGRELESTDRSIDVQVSRLRKLLGEDPHNPRYIQTVWGFGYVFVPDGAPAK